MAGLEGLATIALGVVLLAWPGPTLLVFSQVAGWAMGVAGFVGAVDQVNEGRLRSFAFARAVGLGLVGVVLILWPGPTTLIVTVLVGLWLLFDGGSRLLDTVWAESPTAEVIGNAIAVAEMLLGIVVIARPVGGVRAAAVFAGLGLAAHGLGRIFDAVRGPVSGATT